MRTFKTVTTQVLTTVVCDDCGLQESTDGGYEFHEFTSLNHHCGYGSIHGDGKQVEVDLCQHCFANMFGDMLRVSGKTRTGFVEYWKITYRSATKFHTPCYFKTYNPAKPNIDIILIDGSSESWVQMVNSTFIFKASNY
jgi:antitoxin CcdA